VRRTPVNKTATGRLAYFPIGDPFTASP